MEHRIEVMLVEPGKTPRLLSASDTIEAAAEILGGPVELGCFLPQRVMLISREDEAGLVPNRRMPGGSKCIRGPFLLCGIPEEGSRFASLSPIQRKEFQGIFALPGEFMMVGDTVYMDPDDVADAVYGLWDGLTDGESVVLTKRGSAYAG